MKHAHSNIWQQSGAALVVSLVFLVIMTILALSMSQTTTLEERMAGNARDTNAAFQGAEAALSAAQTAMNTATPPVDNSGVDVTSSAVNDTWWNTTGTQYGTTGKDMPDLQSDPNYVVRLRAANVTHGSLSTPPSEHTTSYYEVLGRSHGTTSDSEAITSAVVGIPD